MSLNESDLRRLLSPPRHCCSFLRKLKNLSQALHFLAEVFSFPHCTKMGRLGLRSCRPLCQFPGREIGER
jgi:hypothetical protein